MNAYLYVFVLFGFFVGIDFGTKNKLTISLTKEFTELSVISKNHPLRRRRKGRIHSQPVKTGTEHH